MTATSPNFAFLADHDPLLVRYAALAERAFSADPEATLLHLRRFAEALAQQAAANLGLSLGPRDDLTEVLARLNDRGAFTPEVRALFHGIRVAGNAVAHPRAGVTVGHREALHQLQMARHLAVWFHRAFKLPGFKSGPFVPPPDPAAASSRPAEALHAELAALRTALADESARARSAHETAAEAEAARLAAEAEARRAWADLSAALDLASETEATLTAARAAFDAQLKATTAAAAAAPAATVVVAQAAHAAATALVLD